MKNHQYALTKIVQIVRLNRFDTVYGHLNTFSFSCISVCCKQGDHRPQPPSKWDRVTMQVWTKHFSSVTAHKQVILGCEEIYFFLGLSLSSPKKSDPKDIYWQFGFFRQHAQIERALVAVGKSDLGKSRVICWCCWSQWETPPKPAIWGCGKEDIGGGPPCDIAHWQHIKRHGDNADIRRFWNQRER